jgi:hypothetical protein
MSRSNSIIDANSDQSWQPSRAMEMAAKQFLHQHRFVLDSVVIYSYNFFVSSWSLFAPLFAGSVLVDGLLLRSHFKLLAFGCTQ